MLWSTLCSYIGLGDQLAMGLKPQNSSSHPAQDDTTDGYREELDILYIRNQYHIPTTGGLEAY